MAEANASRVRFTIGPPHLSEGQRRRSLLLVMAVLPPSGMLSPPNVYFDDSATVSAQGPHFIWGGYVATWLFWQALGEAWNKILDGPPHMPYWHQTKARARNRRRSHGNPFRDFTDTELADRERQLASLIGDNRDRIFSLAVRVNHAEHDSLVKNRMAFARPLSDAEFAIYRPDVLGSPQYIALLYALKMTVELQSALDCENMPVSVYCEDREGDAMQDYMQRAWELLRSRDKERMGQIDFPPGKSRDTPQLQVADMLAWHLHQRGKSAHGAEDDPMWSDVKGGGLLEYTVTARDLESHVAYHKRVWPTDTIPRIWLYTGPEQG